VKLVFKKYHSINQSENCYPFFMSRVPAGFPSPADDYEDVPLDLNSHLIKHPAATFFVQAHGDSMTGAGISDGDLLVVDRAVSPQNGMVVLAIVDNEFTVKRYYRYHNRVELKAENPDYHSIVIHEGRDFAVWGVVAHVIHNPN
jgi:DNA polymerase V